MSSTDTSESGITDEFEQALEEFILAWFVKGADVQGVWVITSSSAFVPDWRVSVEKTSAAELPSEDATFVDE